MKTHRLDGEFPYTGFELSPHWIYRTTEILGDALVSWEGPADVALTEMVDLEDVRAKAPIFSPRMVHFVGEWFVDSLTEGIYLQQVLVQCAAEWLWEHGVRELRREGDDLYYQNRKLSVSIATQSAVSSLVHTAFNIQTEGTPVPTAGLGEMNVDPKAFSEGVLEKMKNDWDNRRRARCKVTPRLG